MRTEIIIYIKKIAGAIPENVEEHTKKTLLTSTNNTMEVLAREIKKYFKKHKIEVDITHETKYN